MLLIDRWSLEGIKKPSGFIQKTDGEGLFLGYTDEQATNFQACHRPKLCETITSPIAHRGIYIVITFLNIVNKKDPHSLEGRESTDPAIFYESHLSWLSTPS